MQAAPFHSDVAEAPPGVTSRWLTTDDGLRIRFAAWCEGTRGTVLLLPGRSEYAEKYGPAAAELRARGYAMAILDWRGQGLSDRLLDDVSSGHVTGFLDYQRDLAAAMAALREMGLPQPLFLLAHSMGACVGLRALHDGLAVRAVAFSAPMWGIRISGLMRPFAGILGHGSRWLGHAHRYAPGASARTYVCEAPFEGNMLTTDPEMYGFLRHQVTRHPHLAIGGPSLNWVHEALRETRLLQKKRPPQGIPAYCALGADEKIIDIRPVHALMARWPGGRLDIVPGAEHEVMMETPETRRRFYDAIVGHFDRHGASD